MAARPAHADARSAAAFYIQHGTFVADLLAALPTLVQARGRAGRRVRLWVPAWSVVPHRRRPCIVHHACVHVCFRQCASRISSLPFAVRHVDDRRWRKGPQHHPHAAPAALVPRRAPAAQPRTGRGRRAPAGALLRAGRAPTASWGGVAARHLGLPLAAHPRPLSALETPRPRPFHRSA